MVDPPTILLVDLLRVDSLPAANPDLVGVTDAIAWIVLQSLNLALQLEGFPIVVAVKEAKPGEGS